MKTRKIISLILNAIAVIASIVGLFLVELINDAGPIIYVKFFTMLTNCLIIVSACVGLGYAIEYLVKKDKEIVIPNIVYVLKLVTAVSALITFLTVVSYLQYQTDLVNLTPNQPLFWENICHHYVAPLAFILGFILFDVDRKYSFRLSFLGVLLLVIYMAYAVPICLADINIFGGTYPYPFMNPNLVPVWAIAFVIVGFLAAGLLLSFLLWLLNRICFLIFTGEDISREETTLEEEKEIEEVEVTEEEKEEVEKIVKTGYSGPRIYHISKRDDKMWQVKFANGKKAIKLFPTQAEAIVFAKKLAKSQEGSIRVHSLKGRIRKAN